MPLAKHFDEDVLELYSLGRLSEPEAAKLEEHLLTCHACLEGLEKSDDFVRAFRVAARGSQPAVKSPAREPSRWRAWLNAGWRPLPMAAALAMAALAVVALAPRDTYRAGEVDVKLAALRGSGSGTIAAVPAQRWLRLELDAKALSGQSYRVELADARGRVMWQSAAPASVNDGTLHATVTRAVPQGLYWVRLYDPASGELAREYGLRAQ